MAAPPPSVSSRMVSLLLRLLTFACLLISLVVLTTNTATLEIDVYDSVKIHFKDVYTYRYMVGTIVIGMAYMILQVAFTMYNVATGNRVMGDEGTPLFDFYGDKVISYVLATGAAAAFGASKDMKEAFAGSSSDIDKFFNKGYVSASLLLLAFVTTAILSVFSSYTLPKAISNPKLYVLL